MGSKGPPSASIIFYFFRVLLIFLAIAVCLRYSRTEMMFREVLNPAGCFGESAPPAPAVMVQGDQKPIWMSWCIYTFMSIPGARHSLIHARKSTTHRLKWTLHTDGASTVQWK